MANYYSMFKLKKDYPPTFFAVWRIVFGLYLTWIFVRLAPYASEIYLSLSSPIDATSKASSIWGVVNIFPYIQSPASVTGFVVFLAFLSLLLTLGVWRRLCAALLFYGWSVLYIQNPIAFDPSAGYIGLLLLGLVVIPLGEPYVLLKSRQRDEESWFMPSVLYWGFWLILGLSFSISGYEKLQSSLWSSGEAIQYMLTSQIGFDNIAASLILMASPITTFLTWLILYSQLLAVPSLMFSWTRFGLWGITVCLFTCSLLFLDLTEVIVGVLIFLAFLFDVSWFKELKKFFNVIQQNPNKAFALFGFWYSRCFLDEVRTLYEQNPQDFED